MFNRFFHKIVIGFTLAGTIPSLSLAEPMLPDVDSLAVEEQSAPSAQSQSAGQRGDNHLLLMWIRRVEALQSEVQQLRGTIEEQQYEIKRMAENQQKLYLDLENRIKVMSAKSQSSQDEQVSELDDGISFSLDSLELDIEDDDEPVAMMDENTLYQQAYQHIQSREFPKAKEKFLSLLAQYPSGQYVPNVHYWLGEIYLIDREVDKAQAAFEAVVEQYPSHQKAKDSMLKLGFVALEKRDFQEAQRILEEVKVKYPGSSAARLADTKLQSFKQ